jgi:carbohydrate-selective porin OprB
MGTRPVGRPRQRWQEDVMEDLKKLKIKNWKETAKDRRTWSKVDTKKPWEDTGNVIKKNGMHGETKNMGQLFSKSNKDKSRYLMAESVFGNETEVLQKKKTGNMPKMKNKCPCYDGILVEMWKNFCEQ